MATVRERFEARYVKDKGGCWLWKVPRSGYLTFMYKDKIMRPHHVSYILHIGPLPLKPYIQRKCGNETCVNPGHLHATTRVDSMRIRMRKLKTHCNRGHEFTPENTWKGYSEKLGRKVRKCRACVRMRALKYWRAKNA